MIVLRAISGSLFISLIALYSYAIALGLIKAVQIAVLGNPMPILIVVGMIATVVVLNSNYKIHYYDESK